jgi:hypothetical protein
MELIREARAILDSHKRQIAEYRLDEYLGKRVTLTLYPANGDAEFMYALRRGTMPFVTLEGTIREEAGELPVGASFREATPTGERRRAYRFVRKAARKRFSVIANFPIATNHVPSFERNEFYVVDIRAA